jgi:hypothetical protein|tara:strand:- start:54 stop:329 length:276 start_codon:yes stop_codon:yes gene_type:complete
MANLQGFPAAEAMLEHMLEGNLISLIEAMNMFGVCNPAAVLTKLRKDGHIIHSRRVPMIKIIVRMNQYMVMKPPADLPTKECLMVEYWISR